MLISKLKLLPGQRVIPCPECNTLSGTTTSQKSCQNTSIITTNCQKCDDTNYLIIESKK